MVLSQVEQQLKEKIEWSLQNFMITNAIFLAERLVNEPSCSAEDKEFKLSLLARAYFAENSPHKVEAVLKSSTSEQNGYLYAFACFQTAKLEEGERALMRHLHSLGAHGYYLLGQICERQARIQDAINYYSKALNQNPSLWSAYEKLCKLGFFVDPATAFKSQAMKENPVGMYSPSENLGFPLSSANIEKSPSPSRSPKGQRGFQDLQAMLTELGKAFLAYSQYSIEEALQHFKALPDSQRNSAWSLCQQAKCYVEKYNYSTAIDLFQRAFQTEPQRVQDSDYYSSALWYEKRGTELCYTLHSALKTAYYSPQTWVIAGNFFSLQKERETAIKCFTRAIQLNPYYSYAYSLCGHEHLANEDFEQARYHYESATKIDPRQFTALWGLGSMYFKQERFTQSLKYYKDARQINPVSGIILTYLGVNYKTIGHHEEAINCFEEAIRLDKNNPLPKFQLGILLSQLDRDQDALSHLETLCQENPRESHLYIQIGKIHAKLGDAQKAMKFYNDAQDLNPKNQTEVKNLIEQLHGSSSFPIVPY